jgi:hypothetical protein
MSKRNKRKPAPKTHNEMVAQWMSDPAFKAEYDALEEEYQILRQKLQINPHKISVRNRDIKSNIK